MAQEPMRVKFKSADENATAETGHSLANCSKQCTTREQESGSRHSSYHVRWPPNKGIALCAYPHPSLFLLAMVPVVSIDTVRHFCSSLHRSNTAQHKVKPI